MEQEQLPTNTAPGVMGLWSSAEPSIMPSFSNIEKDDPNRVDMGDEQFLTWPAEKSLQLYSLPFLLCIGVAGNILCVVTILLKGQLKKTGTGLLLVLLAMSDFLVLSTGALRSWVWVFSDMTVDIAAVNGITCRLHTWLTYLSVHLSAWTLVLVTCERLVAVYKPMSSRAWMTRRNLAVAYGVALFALSAIDTPLLVHSDVTCDTEDFDNTSTSPWQPWQTFTPFPTTMYHRNSVDLSSHVPTVLHYMSKDNFISSTDSTKETTKTTLWNSTSSSLNIGNDSQEITDAQAPTVTVKLVSDLWLENFNMPTDYMDILVFMFPTAHVAHNTSTTPLTLPGPPGSRSVSETSSWSPTFPTVSWSPSDYSTPPSSCTRKCEYTPAGGTPWSDYLLYTDLLLSCLLPGLFILVANTMLIHRLRKLARRRQALTSTPRGSDRRSQSLTVMLVAVSVLFLVTACPLTLYILSCRVIWVGVEQEYPDWIGIVSATVTLFYYLNHSLNFFFYFLTGPVFRQAFIQRFCCKKTKPVLNLAPSFKRRSLTYNLQKKEQSPAGTKSTTTI